MCTSTLKFSCHISIEFFVLPFCSNFVSTQIMGFRTLHRFGSKNAWFLIFLHWRSLWKFNMNFCYTHNMIYICSQWMWNSMNFTVKFYKFVNFSALITVINFNLLIIIFDYWGARLKRWVIFILKAFDESLMVSVADVI